MTSTLAAVKLNYEQARDAAIAAIAIPHDDSFTLDFLADERIGELGSVLIEHCEELGFIQEFSVAYLWKRTGGKSKDRVTLGKCIKTAGLVHFFGRTDYVIWLAADHSLRIHNDFLNKQRAQDLNLAALVYHELLHIDRDENGSPSTKGHEFEGFASEIERFGIWRDDMRQIATAFQASLFPEDAVSQ